MGNSLTSTERLERLGVSPKWHSQFKDKVWNHLMDVTVNLKLPLSAKDPKLVSAVNKFLQHPDFAYYREPLPDQQPPLQETEIQKLLMECVHAWIDEEERKESQDDPSYSSKAPGSPDLWTKGKKRKRPSEKPSLPKTPVGKPSKKVKGVQDGVADTSRDKITPYFKSPQVDKSKMTNTQRSPTIDSGPSMLPDISPGAAQTHNGNNGDVEDDDNDVDFPPIGRLLAEKSPRTYRTTTDPSDRLDALGTSSKGKEPVRNPPSPPPEGGIPSNSQGPQTPQSAGFGPGHDEEPNFNELSAGQASPSISSPDLSRQDSRHPRSFRNQVDIEEHSSAATRSPTTSGFVNVLHPASSSQPPLSSMRKPVSPPPTLRPVRYRDATTSEVTPISLTSPVTGPSQSREERLEQLLNSIVKYVGQCEAHNLALADSGESSTREVEIQRIRAAAFSYLYVDISSRITAFRNEENGAAEMTRVTSYCLWPV